MGYNMAETQVLRERQCFYMTPNMIDDMGLSPFAYRLYGHFKRVAGEDGKCWQSTSALATHCCMSIGSVSKAKKELVEKKLIAIENQKGERGFGRDIVTILDVWQANRENCSPSEHISSPHEQYVHLVKSKEEPSKKNPYIAQAASEVKVTNISAPKKQARTPIPEPVKWYRGIIGRYPRKALYHQVIETIGKKRDGPLLRRCYEAWLARGYNPQNMNWLFEWYVSGAIPPMNGKRSEDAELQAIAEAW